VEEDDEDAWDFGTVKQAPPQVSKPALQQMHHSSSQYSVNSFSTENKYQQQTPQQLPHSVSRNQVTLQQQQPSSPINEVTVSKNASLFNTILSFKFVYRQSYKKLDLDIAQVNTKM
jgi:hypothetical protein